MKYNLFLTGFWRIRESWKFIPVQRKAGFLMKFDRGEENTYFDLQAKILAALRRIIRAVDLQSRKLETNHGITGTQLITLRTIVKRGPCPTVVIARAVAITPSTASRIIDRLESASLVRRERSGKDRRTVIVSATTEGSALALNAASDLLQERFHAELSRLPEWEQTSMLATLQRIATMMDAEGLDASPLLETSAIDSQDEIAEPKAVKARAKE